MTIPDAAMGSIIAAIIGGLVVFISAVLSKEQKTSEFRQAWIDELRKDISQYMSGVTEVAALSSAKKKDGGQIKFLEDNFSLIHELQSIEYRILLRLNYSEHSALIEKVRNYRKEIIAAYNDGSASRVEPELASALLENTSRVLKYEWARVKSGENTFRAVKNFAVVIAIFGTVVIVTFTSLDVGKVDLKSMVERNEGANTQQTKDIIVPALSPPSKNGATNQFHQPSKSTHSCKADSRSNPP